jgi:hypothetical protein
MYYVINTNLFLFFRFEIYIVISMSPSLSYYIRYMQLRQTAGPCCYEWHICGESL